jgi:hypothetical protein
MLFKGVECSLTIEEECAGFSRKQVKIQRIDGKEVYHEK